MKNLQGAFQISRSIFDSDLWLKKPSTWKVIWIYIIGRVSFIDTPHFKRGEGYFNFTNERHHIGNDITPDTIKKFLQFGRRTAILSTTRSTRGVVIKVLNYGKYQDLSSYTSTSPSTRAAPEPHSDIKEIRNKNNNTVATDVTKRLIEEFNKCFEKQYKPTLKRISLVRLRLESFTEEQLVAAVNNLSKSPFHRGENDRRWVADPDYLFRNDENVDRAINLEIIEDKDSVISIDEVERRRNANHKISA